MRQRHFVGFFNVPVQVPPGGHPLYGYSEKPDSNDVQLATYLAMAGFT